MTKVSTAVLISGSGTTLQSIIDAARSDPAFPARLDLVISNRPAAFGLERAAQAGIKTLTINHKDFASREDFDAALQTCLEENGIEFVCLAGFMRILTDGFAQQWAGRMLNIHPTLLPAFKGHRAHEQVLRSTAALSGATVHLATPELDGGPILAQAAVRRLGADTVETLSARVRDVELQLYPLAIRAYLRDAGTAPPPLPPHTDTLFSLNERLTLRP